VNSIEAPYCNILSEIPMPFDEFNLLFSIILIKQEEPKKEEKELIFDSYKKIFELYGIPKKEWEKRIEIAEAYLKQWGNINKYEEPTFQEEKDTRERYVKHLKNNFCQLLIKIIYN